ncbi:MAG: ATP-dependent Clp protease proteolytic subunit [Clostridium sp.]
MYKATHKLCIILSLLYPKTTYFKTILPTAEAKEILRVRSRINQLISNATGQPLEKIEQDTDRNYWLDSKEAVEYGIVGKIISRYDDIDNTDNSNNYFNTNFYSYYN